VSDSQHRGSLFASERLDVVETENGVLVIVGNRERGQAVGEEIWPEQIAHLAHALNQWIAMFTSNA
jgi:hypothetical protein